MTPDNDTTIKSAVSLRDAGAGVFWLAIADAHAENRLSAGLIAKLLRALANARAEHSLKVLVLSGLESCFAQGGRDAVNAAIEQRLYATLAGFPAPLVGALRGDARGAGFLLAALCDFMVCSEAGEYGYTSAAAGLFPTAEEERLFVSRCGEPLAAQLLYGAEIHRGATLRGRGFNGTIVAADEVHARAQRLAHSIAAKSAHSLRLLKQHLTQPLLKCAQALRRGSPLPAPATSNEPWPIKSGPITSVRESIRLQSGPGELLVVRLCAGAVAADLCAVLAQIQEALISATLSCRSIVLVSDHEEFLPGLVGEEPHVHAAVRELSQALLKLPLPIVAVLGSAVPGAPWLITQCCQAVLYPRDGQYCATGLLAQAPLAAAAAALFTRRLGAHTGKEILLRGTRLSGVELAQRAAVTVVADAAEGLAVAHALGQFWASFPAPTLAAWKSRHAHRLQEEVDEAADWPLCQSESTEPPNLSHGGVPPRAELRAGEPIALASRVINASVHAGGIVRVRMEDRAAKNLFSADLIAGMHELFDKLEQSDAYKVVILSGYENYFACGGTRAALMAIQEGRTRFTDDNTYLWALRCRLPVIAALQGHAVGGGWSLGLFADFTLLSAESQYLSPYLGYGFTPGAGATLIVPHKLGVELACQTLLTAEEYCGSELEARAVPLAVYPRAQLEAAAFALAQDLTRHSRESLIAQKSRFNRALQRALPQTLQQELIMHEQTFVGDAHTLEQIQSNFAPPAEVTSIAPDARRETAADTQFEITASLKTLLARELHMNEGDIDEDTQFIDLGLDSITGVTWMKKVNEKFSTSIAAIKVYTHSNLTQMSRFVQELVTNSARAPVTPEVPVTAVARDPLPDITATLKQLLAQELHMQVQDVDENTPFIDLGLDSITGVTWMRKINEQFATAIQAIKVYSYPTLTLLGGHVRAEIGKRSAPVAAARPTPAASTPAVRAADPVQQRAVPALPEPRRAAAHFTRPTLPSWRTAAAATSTARNAPRSAPRVAVVGMAGRFPKARTLEQYWDNIANGRNCISEIPRDRWDISNYYREGDAVAGKTNSKWMGLLEDHDRFDPQFFEISPKEALSMDPQQRVFLQACWHAVEDAGYAPRSLSGAKCGVFAGCGPSDYHLLSRELQISALGFTGGDTSILAARVSYLLNLQGPCLTIETACSSSLVAIATACDNLAAGNCDLALAGGVYIACGPDLHVKTAQTGMLSRQGRCFTFDQRADGFVPGEGVGVIMLKRLEDARADGDDILGVIEGWGVNQDGKTNGITAPNPDSQMRLQRDVYEKFGIDPAAIQLVEAHGTGTKLGDPIEVNALQQAFAAHTRKVGYCALGSVKSNIGHCFTAAGAASVIKVLLALEHEQLPPTINFEKLNEHIALDDSPFFVNDRLRAWELRGADRRRAAVSGFGFGGTNAHVVIAQYHEAGGAPACDPPVMEQGKVIIPLSARTPGQLRQKASDLAEFIARGRTPVVLESLAYTLQIGREAMEARVAFLAGSTAELGAALQAFIAGKSAAGGVWQGEVSGHKEGLSLLRQDASLRESLIDKYVAERKLSSLASLWVKGLELDWRKLQGARQPRRARLPTYPFAQDRYWIEDRARRPELATSTVKLSALLHRNTSRFGEQRYSSSFDGTEALFARASGDGPSTLPPAAYLEMARAAAADAGGRMTCTAVEMTDVTWGQPFVVREGEEITTVVSAADDARVDFEIFSGARGSETVHCRGQVAFAGESAGTAFEMPIKLLEPALAGDGVLIGLNRLRVVSGCPDAVTRRESAQHGLLDLDLLDTRGNVCVEIRGLAQRPASALAGPVALPAPTPETAAVPDLAQLQRELKSSLAKVLYLEAAEIKLDRPFIELGLDSIVGVEWVNEINKQYTLNMTATKLYDYSNLADLARFVDQELRSRCPAAPTIAPAPAPAPALATATALSRRELQQQLTTSLAKALYLNPTDIKVDRPFVELGLDSIVGVEWVGEVNKEYQVNITATKVYDYTNLADFSAFLAEEIANTRGSPAPAPLALEPTREVRAAEPASAYPVLARRAPAALEQRTSLAITPGTGKIAVIGMSGRYPKAANLRKFWDNLVQGRNCITEVPPSRWDVSRYYDPDVTKEGKIYCKWLGMLDDVDCFDPAFFKISPAEAKTMDPQHRLFLEESYRAFEDAGYSSRALSNRKCGVYLGIIGNEYARIVARNSATAVDLTGNNYAIGAARVAYFLNLKGPAISIDTACSSSLVAIHLACQGLLNRETDMALAGGVTVYLEPEAYLGMCQAGMLSADGQCKTFDNAANGFVPGEGAGAVVLKRLEDAERDGDFIYGVILGSGINQDGKTNGITAPSVNSQMALERDLYERCGIHPESVSYVETHGTGTKLGDPIELEALATVFAEKTEKRNYCALGSVKSNVGHTSGAAGVAGVHKVLLCMQQRMLVPSLNVKTENALFDFKRSPFYISRETRPWESPSGTPRRAGVSSFGFSGTNAHLILEEYAKPATAPRAAGTPDCAAGTVILLSARTADQVRHKAQELLEFIRAGVAAKSADLEDIAYTLMEGREMFDERVGLLAGSLAELADRLEAYLRGATAIPNLWRGKVERDAEGAVLISRRADGAERVGRAIASRERAQVVEGWVAGVPLEWAQLGGAARPRRISLPTYPFARQRYWVADRSGADPTGRAAIARLHPLLHSNISVIGEQSYCATFTGEEFFQIPMPPRFAAGVGTHALSAGAYLEMARAAVERAVPRGPGSRLPTLQNVVWGRPLFATRGRQVNIALFWRSADQVDFEIYSLDRASQGAADEIVHCQGQAVLGGDVLASRVDIASLEAAMGRGTLGRAAVYRLLAAAGRDYPHALQIIEAIHQGEAQLLARLRVPASLEATLPDYLLHPGLADGALQACIGMRAPGARQPGDWALPCALESVQVHAPCSAEMFVWMRASAERRAGRERPALDIDLLDRDGRVCVQMRGVEYSRLPSPAFALEPAPEPSLEPAAATQPRVARAVALSAAQALPATRRAAGKPTRIALG